MWAQNDANVRVQRVTGKKVNETKKNHDSVSSSTLDDFGWRFQTGYQVNQFLAHFNANKMRIPVHRRLANLSEMPFKPQKASDEILPIGVMVMPIQAKKWKGTDSSRADRPNWPPCTFLVLQNSMNLPLPRNYTSIDPR